MTSQPRWVTVALLLALLFGQAGCTGFDAFMGSADAPLKAPACKMTVNWISQVVVSQDTVNNGEPLKCLAGRVYLFSGDMNHLVAGEGTLFVDLYDPSIKDAAGKPKQLEHWEIDAETMSKKLLAHDFWGWGYTLILPWYTYRPDLSTVEMRVRYNPTNGGFPLFSSPSTLTLAGQGDVPEIARASTVKH